MCEPLLLVCDMYVYIVCALLKRSGYYQLSLLLRSGSTLHYIGSREWLQRFELCSAANGWKEETKAVKLPTLLEGDALAVWLDLNEDEKTT